MVAVLADDALEALALAGLLVAGPAHGELGVAAAALAAFGEDYKALKGEAVGHGNIKIRLCFGRKHLRALLRYF